MTVRQTNNLSVLLCIFYTKKLESQTTALGHGIDDFDNCLTVFDAVVLIVSIQTDFV